MGNILFGISSWFAAVWFFILILAIQIFLAGNGQFTDLLRRELSKPTSSLFLALILAIFSLTLLRATDRSLVMMLSEKKSFGGESQLFTSHQFEILRVITLSLLALGLITVFFVANMKLSSDVFTISGRGYLIWRNTTPILAIIVFAYLIKTADPSFSFLKASKPVYVGNPVLITSFLVCVAAVGILIAYPGPLKALTPLFSNHALSITHILLATLVVVVGSGRYIAYKNNFPLAPVVVLSILGLTLITKIVSAIGNHGALDNRGVQELEPKIGARIDVHQAVELKEIGDEPIIIFVAEGGGIHALYRAANVLAMIEAEIPGTWEQIFATSTVSGGSMGTALFASMYHSMKSGDFSPDQLQAKVCNASNSDFLTPVVARLTFSEPLSTFWPSDGFDRGKALEIALEAASEKSAKNSLSRIGLTAIDYRSNPFFCFNTLSATFGDRLVLSALKLPIVRSLSDYEDSQDVTFTSAATLSARFPLFPGGGRVRLSDSRYDRLLDGGIYDNSGLMTAYDLMSELKRQGKTNQIVLVVVGNNMAPYGNLVDRKIPPRDGAFAAALAFPKGFAQTLFAKNTEAAIDLRKLSDNIANKVTVINFIWDFDAMNAPLGWYLDEERQRAISWLLGSKQYWNSDGEGTRLTREFPSGWSPEKKISRLRDRGDFSVKFVDKQQDRSVKAQLQQMRAFNRHELQRLADIVTNKALILDLD